nr:glycosyltransferase family 4 protein [Cellulomonas humilata]
MCVVHDWRHVKNPQEFSRAQRLYRQLWSASVRWAGCVAVISRKTGAETQAINPGARPVVVENGRDHPRRWGAVGRTGGPPALVTFGHHPNKRPEMVIDALSDSAELRHADATLTVLGARGDYATALRGRAEAAGIGDAVKLPGFVEPATYEATIAGADVVVLASSDEGFGLPVAEAQFFGVPVVVASDSGLDDIHRGLIVSAPDPERLSSALELAVGQGVQPGARDIRTWAQTARELRVLAARLLDRAARDEAEAVS